MATYGRPDYSRSGPRRDALAAPARRALTADRALSADVATNATNATNATLTTNVSTDAPKVILEDDDLIALVSSDGRIQPVTLANLLAFLESRYVLTPIP